MPRALKPFRFSPDAAKSVLRSLPPRGSQGSAATSVIKALEEAVDQYRAVRAAGAHKKLTRPALRREIERVRDATDALIAALREIHVEADAMLRAGLLSESTLDAYREYLLRQPAGGDLLGGLLADLAAVAGAWKRAEDAIGRSRAGPRTDDAATRLAMNVAIVWYSVTGTRPTLTEEGRDPTFLGFIRAVFEAADVESAPDRAAGRAVTWFRQESGVGRLARLRIPLSS